MSTSWMDREFPKDLSKITFKKSPYFVQYMNHTGDVKNWTDVRSCVGLVSEGTITDKTPRPLAFRKEKQSWIITDIWTGLSLNKWDVEYKSRKAAVEDLPRLFEYIREDHWKLDQHSDRLIYYFLHGAERVVAAPATDNLKAYLMGKPLVLTDRMKEAIKNWKGDDFYNVYTFYRDFDLTDQVKRDSRQFLDFATDGWALERRAA